MNTEHLGRIIGKNMLADIDLLPRYLALTGVSGHKPFECVGTIEENMAAMYLASLKPNPPLNVKYFMKNVPQLARARQNVDKIMNNYDNTNLIPRQLSTKIPSVFNNWLK